MHGHAYITDRIAAIDGHTSYAHLVSLLQEAKAVIEGRDTALARVRQPMDIEKEVAKLTFDRDMAREVVALVRRAAAAERDANTFRKASADLSRQLVARPQLLEALATFADYWGLDCYDPPEETISGVRQIVMLAVASARDLQMLDEQHS